LCLGITAEAVTGETGAAEAAAVVGAEENPIISILLETVSPENNDASAFSLVMALLRLKGSSRDPGVDSDLGSLRTTDTLVGASGASISVVAKTCSWEKLPEWSDTEA
jgi:hypothetical protein